MVPDAEGMLQVTRSLGDVPFHRSGVALATPEFAEVELDEGCKLHKVGLQIVAPPTTVVVNRTV